MVFCALSCGDKKGKEERGGEGKGRERKGGRGRKEGGRRRGRERKRTKTISIPTNNSQPPAECLRSQFNSDTILR